jgi:hypothetical protein
MKGVPQSLYSFPQDWGIKGADEIGLMKPLLKK